MVRHLQCSGFIFEGAHQHRPKLVNSDDDDNAGVGNDDSGDDEPEDADDVKQTDPVLSVRARPRHRGAFQSSPRCGALLART